MYNGSGVIMSHNNKKKLVIGLSESDIPCVKTTLIKAAKTIFSVSNDSASIMDEIHRRPGSCVLLDMFMEDRDAVSFVREAKFRFGKRCPEFVVICEFVSFRLERELYGLGVSAVVTSDMPAGTLWSMLLDYCERSNEPSGDDVSGNDQSEIGVMVTDVMHRIGVPAHIKGYQYLRCAIISAILRPEIINAVTKELYPSVAERYCTTSSRVERAIRHAIELAWDRGDVDYLCSYFGSTIHNFRGKPTNSEFIAMISDKLRMTLRVAS